MMFGTDNNVSFDPGPHRYTHADGREFSSVSRLLSSIEVPFDRDGISKAMARKLASEKGISIQDAQAEILSEWDDKRDSASDHGNWIHDNLENYHKLGTCDEKLRPVANKIKELYQNYYKIYSEVLLSDTETSVAGQTDLVVQRQRTENTLFDFYDYKTNEQKGIQFDSINRKKDPWKHYNKFFLPPFDHLEDCNYNRYSLQLSVYAYIAQRQYGINIGRLAIIFIDKDLQIQILPVAYLRHEAQRLLSQNTKKLKPLPVANEWDVPSASEDEDDW